MRALLYGSNSLAANLPVAANPNGESNLAGLYQEAAADMAANRPLRPALLDDAGPTGPRLVICGNAPVGADPLATCLLSVSQNRRDKLAATYETHSHQIYNGYGNSGTTFEPLDAHLAIAVVQVSGWSSSFGSITTQTITQGDNRIRPNGAITDHDRRPVWLHPVPISARM